MEKQMKQLRLYTDSIAFWMRCGVRREDNLMALATIDVSNAFGINCIDSFKIPYYIEKGKALLSELASPRYDVNRGRIGWLNGYEF